MLGQSGLNHHLIDINAGDRVCHVKEPDVGGTVVSVDITYLSESTKPYIAKSACVHWDDDTDPHGIDVQWVDKLVLLEERHG